MAQPAAVLSILVRANTSNATRGLIRFNSQLGATEAKSNKALAAVKTLTKGAALGAGVGLGYAVKKAADFEQQLDSLGSVSSASGKQMEQFRKQAMKAGADTKFSALDAAKAQTELAKGGLSVRNIMRGGLRSALALAAAGEMDLADAASTTANAMNLFGLKGKDSIKVADALAAAANATTADVADFAMALTQGGGVAKTAGLSFQETVLALEALAKAGTKNSDAGTSLKTSIIQLLKPSAKQAALAKELGLNFVDASGHMKSMADISTMLRAKLGDMTKAQRVAALATLAGTDGVRTLTALYDAGPQKLDKWSKGLNKSGTAAEVAARKQDNLKGKLENLQGSVETIAISIGSKLLPALTDAAKKITDVLNDPKLTASEKLSKFSKMFGDAIASAGPVVAQAAGKVGVAAVHGFFEGWHKSPLWFRLLTAGFLMQKLGGFKAFRQMGRQGGAQMAAGMAETVVAQGGTAAAGGALAGKFAKTKGAFRTVGRNVLGVALLAGVADAATTPDLSFVQRIHQAFSTISLGVIAPPISKVTAQAQRAAVKSMLEDLDKLETNYQSMRINGADNMQALAATTKANMVIIADVARHNSGEARASIQLSFNTAANVIAKAMRSGRVSVKNGMAAIEQQVAIHSAGSKSAAAAQFGQMRDVIARTMSRGGKITEDGMKVIRGLVLDQLALYGLSPTNALKHLDKVPKLKQLIKPGPTGGGGIPHRKQTGGMVVGGTGSGDKVPLTALVEPGERVFVLNRSASQQLGALERLNSAVPRFAQGGTIPGLSVQGASSPLRDIVQGGLNKVRGKANDLLASAALASAVTGGGESSTTGLVGQVKRALAWARSHGWTGSVTSGFRTLAEQTAIWNSGIRPAAKPGTSEHEKGRAVDITDIAGFARAMASAPANAKLLSLVPGDPVHWSVSGHQRGGLLKLQKGGTAAPWGQGISGKELPSFMRAIWSYAGPMMGSKGAVPQTGPGKMWHKSQGVLGETWPNGIRLPQRTLDALATPGSGLTTTALHAQALSTLFHELAHTQQDRGLNSREAEGGAYLWANWAAPRVLAKLGIHYNKHFGTALGGTGSDMGWVSKHKGTKWWKKTQFRGFQKGGLVGKFDSTAYGPPWGGIQGGGTTAGGTNLHGSPHRHILAVDPSVLKMGSKYWASPNPFGYKGPFLADDTGGAIKGNRIDFYDWRGRQEQLGWGRRSVSLFNSSPFGTGGGGGTGGATPKQTPQQTKKLKAMAKRLKRQLRQIKGIGLSKDIESRLRKYTGNSAEYADLADRASRLSGDGDPAKVLGHTETGWLEKQLKELFKLRNALIRAHKVVVEKRDQTTKQLAKAYDFLKHHPLGKDTKGRDPISGWSGVSPATGSMNAWNKTPQERRKKLMDKFVARGGQLPSDRRFLPDGRVARNRAGLVTRRQVANYKDKIIPALKATRSGLNTRRGELLSDLQDVQGHSTMKLLKKLPAIGALGGSIFDAQMRLQELGAKPDVTDTSTDTTRSDLLAQMLREANQRTAVSERQFQVLKDMPPYGGVFHQGGVVPGPIGAERMILAKGGETINPNGAGAIHLHFAPGTEWLRDFVRVEVDRGGRRATRGGRAPLPGRGGG